MAPPSEHDEGLELFFALAERDEAPVFVCTPAGRLRWCNGAFVRHFGAGAGGAVEGGLGTVDPSPSSGAAVGGVTELVAAGPLESALRRLSDAGGRVRSYLVTSSRVRWRGEDGLLGVLRAVAAAEADGAAPERGFAALFEAAADGLVRLRADGRISLANARFRELVGLSPGALADRTFYELVHPEDRRRVVDAFESLGDPRLATLRVEFRGRLPDGAERWFEAAVSRLDDEHQEPSVVAVVRDTSDARRLEAKAREAQTLESLAELASGIAHALSDHMTSVVANASLLLGAPGLPAALAASVAGIPLAAERVEHLSKVLLTYAGQAPRAVAVVDVRTIVEDAVRRLGGRVPRAVDVRVALPPQRVAVSGDAAQLGELVQSLLANAAESVEGEGEVRVEVLELTVDGRANLEARRWVPTEPGPGRYACLRIADTGGGMEPHVLSKAFVPFVTTKGAGRGLGLPTVLGIARGHSGTVGLWSVAGHGTTVDVLVPLAEAPAVVDAPVGLAPVPAPAARPRGCVLVVDDEAMICDLERRILDLNGYCVECADDGQAAIERFSATPDRFDAVVVDHAMPGLRGDALACRLRALSAAVGIVHTSGLRDEALLARLPRGTVLLDKPFTASELVDAVEAAMRGASRARGQPPR